MSENLDNDLNLIYSHLPKNMATRRCDINGWVLLCMGIIVFLCPSHGLTQMKEEIITFNIFHTPVRTASPNQAVAIKATISDPRKVSYASVNYRRKGERAFKTIFMTHAGGDIFSAAIPGKDVLPPTIEYYIYVMDIRGVPHVIFGDPRHPQSVSVVHTAGAPPSHRETGQLEEEFALFAAEDIVYGAAKRVQRVQEAPASVSVLTDEDIERMGATSLPEILRLIPGVDVDMLNPSYSQVGVRGFATRGNMTLLLIDGREVNIELVGMPFWNALLPPAKIALV